MQQLRFAAEVRPASEIDVAKTEVKPAEMKLARQLIDQQQPPRSIRRPMSTRSEAASKAAIQKKVEGQEISVSEAPEPGTGQGHRPDGSAAREPREDRIGAGVGHEARAAQGAEARRRDRRKPARKCEAVGVAA